MNIMRSEIVVDDEKFIRDKIIIADAIINTFNIDPNKTFIEEKSGFVYIWFVKEGEKYYVCHFTEYITNIVVYIDKHLNNRNLFSIKLNRESAKAIAKYIKDKSGNNKDIFIYSEPIPGLGNLLYWLKMKSAT